MENQFKNNVTWSRWTAFTKKHEKDRMQWFVISFIFQAVLCLPLPAVFVFYYGATPYCLGITILLFFINLTAGFNGAGIRIILSLTVISLAINLLMGAYYVLR